MKLLGADESLGFVNYVYQHSRGLLAPFLLTFPSPNISGRFVLEFATLFAIFTYAFVSYLIQEVLDFLSKKK